MRECVWLRYWLEHFNPVAMFRKQQWTHIQKRAHTCSHRLVWAATWLPHTRTHLHALTHTHCLRLYKQPGLEVVTRTSVSAASLPLPLWNNTASLTFFHLYLSFAIKPPAVRCLCLLSLGLLLLVFFSLMCWSSCLYFSLSLSSHIQQHCVVESSSGWLPACWDAPIGNTVKGGSCWWNWSAQVRWQVSCSSSSFNFFP